MPSLTEGTELVGEFTGSGYRVPPQLVHRYDGQVIHLPPLLYQTVKLLADVERDGRAPANGPAAVTRVAARLSKETGRQFTAEHIVYLIDKKLAPLGIMRYSDGSPPEVPKANPFLTLRFRKAVLNERATWFISGLFAWLFQPLVLMAVVMTFLVAEVWVFLGQNVGGAVTVAMAQPGSVLVVVLLTLASAAFHEIGHASACRYSKVRPGVMGCGIYLVWPAFYTDVTNSYRLGRAGRLRTDLGGVYFNAIFLIALITMYAQTGSTLLLAAVLFTNLEMAQQLLPTLRFDGYYIVSDLVGIPDLFKYIGPILRRAVLRKPADEKLNALKRWPQIVVTVWVLTVLPAIVVQLGIVVSRLPQWMSGAWDASGMLAQNALAGDNPFIGVTAAVVQIALLLLPLIGVVLILWQLTSALAKGLYQRFVAAERRERLGAWYGTRRRALFWCALALCACTVGAIAYTMIPRSVPAPAVAADPLHTPTPRPSAPHSPAPKDSPSKDAAPEQGAAPVSGSDDEFTEVAPSPQSAKDDAKPGSGGADEPSAKPSGEPRHHASTSGAPHDKPGTKTPPKHTGGSGDEAASAKPRCTSLLGLPLGPLLCR